MDNYLKTELYNLIKEDEDIFDFIQQGSLDGLWYWDLENPENEYLSNRFWKVLGYNPDEMPHKSSAWQNIINQDDLKLALDNFNKHIENPNHPYDQEVRYTHKNGSTVWVRCRGMAIRDKEGKALRMLGVHQDITDLKNTVKKLKQEKDEHYRDLEKYKAMYEKAPLAFQFLDDEGNIIEINPQWSKILGYKKEDVIGKWFGDFLDDDYIQHFKKNFPKFKKQGYINDVQFKMTRKGGESVFVSFEGKIGYDDEGNFRQTYCTFKDITSEKLALNELQLKQFHLENAQSLGKIGSWDLDINKNELIWTDENYRIFGVPTGTPMTYELFLNCVHPDDREYVDKKWTAAMQQEEKYDINHRLLMEDGEVKWVREKAELEFNENGDCIRGVGFTQDITEKKEAEERYKELVSTLNSGVAVYKVIKDGKSGSDYIIQDFNEFALKHENLKKDEVIGKSLKDIRPNIDEFGLIDVFRKVWKTGEPAYFPAKVYIDENFSNYYENRVFRLSNGEIVAIYDDVSERETARLDLVESESKLKNIFDHSTNMFYSHTVDQILSYVSPQVKEILGYTQEEALIKWTEFVTDNPLNQKGFEYTNKAIETCERQPTYLLELRRKDGRKIMVEVREAPLVKNGRVESIVGSLTDVTERIKSEQKIKEQNKEYEALNEELKSANEDLSEAVRREEESNKRFEMAMKASKDGIFDWNLITNEIYYSPGWKSMLGYKDHELPNDFSVWEKLTKPEDIKRSWEMQNELINKKRDRFVMEFKMKHKDGHWVDVLSRANAYFDENGKAFRIVGTHTDVTAQKQYENRIKNQNAFIKMILDNSPIGFATNDIDSLKVTYINSKFSEIYGWPKEEFSTTHDFFNKVFPDKEYREKIQSLVMSDIESGDPDRMHWDNLKVTTKNGEKRIVNAYNIPLFDQNTMISTVQDVTEKFKQENRIKEQNAEYEVLNEELQQTNDELFNAKEKAELANRLKTEFLNNMSHEVRTPINGIIGFSDLLNEETINSEKRKQFTKIIINSGKQLVRVIDDILTISSLETRQEKLMESKFSLNELFDELYSIFKLNLKNDKISLKIKKGLADNKSIIISDKAKYSKIIDNLLENAIKYTNEGFVEFGYYIKDNNIIAYVKDSGIGIDPKNHDLVFDRFSQEDKEVSKKRGGLGLGLAISKENAKLIGGDITLESEKGKGSTFYFTIPYKTRE